MKEFVLGIILGIQAFWDLRDKAIPCIVSIAGALAGIGFCFAEGRSLASILIACIPGLAALLIAKLSNEVIGYGDGILLVVMGFFLSIEKLVAIGMLAFSIAGVFALILLVIFHKKGSYRIPFVPFLAFAYGLNYLIDLGGAG